MVDARTKSIAFFELFSQGLSVPKCHFRSDEIVEIWGTLLDTKRQNVKVFAKKESYNARIS